MKLITTMVALVLISPFLYLALWENYPHSFWTKNFIWIYLFLLLVVFLSNLQNRD
ncbi:MAG TPA: hypothetical protein PKU87_02470 [Candidatus Atribacteria bacterium]|nr:hypothetical protein [Candidatus Atribacteria bacterium]HPU08767.1 hypothetical protein [Candidatus Atribacteria bacterium]HPZ81606.1 hypothetical protein [Candidatus Atribacteria bacterium]HQE24666.1 hypothetical protein [Candidatus Atribacteria bacterium]